MSPLSGLALQSGTTKEAYQSKNLRRNTFKVYPSLDAEENPEQASTTIPNKAVLLVKAITGPKEAEASNPSSGVASHQTWHCRYSRCTVNGQIGVNGPPPPPVQPKKYLLSKRHSPPITNGQTKSLKSARTDNTVNNGPMETSKPVRRPYNSVNNGLTETSKSTRRPYAVHSGLTETSKLTRKASNTVNNGQTETSKLTRTAVHNGSTETSKSTRKAYNGASNGQMETSKSTRRPYNDVSNGRTETTKSTRRPSSVNNGLTETSKLTRRPYAVDNGQMETSKSTKTSLDKISPLPGRGEGGSKFVSNEGIPLDTTQDLIAQLKLSDNQSSDNSSNSSLCTDTVENEQISCTVLLIEDNGDLQDEDNQKFPTHNGSSSDNSSTTVENEQISCTVFPIEDNGDLQDEDNQNFPTHNGSSSDNSSSADFDSEEFSCNGLEVNKGDMHDEDKNESVISDASTEEDLAEIMQKWNDGNEQIGEENHATLSLSTETEMANQEEKEKREAEEEEVTSFDDDVSSCISTEAGSIAHEACCNHIPFSDDSNRICKACEEAVALRRKRHGGYLKPGAAEEQETVNLRRMAIEGRKHCEEFMVDSALENAVLKLASHGKSKVKVLVTAFETVLTTL